MGEPLYGAQPPTGYSEKSSAWINTGALLNRLNFALALASNKLPGVHSAIPDAESADAMARALAGSTLSESTMKTIRARGDADKATVAGLILGSPEFQKQ
jgi:uncharacterized protein (DUF1800 family)